MGNRALAAFCSVVLLTTACSREPAAPPRETPQIRLAGATELVDFSDWGWKDETRTQMVVDMTRTGGPVGSVRVEFYAGAKMIGEDIIPGNVLTTSNGPHTREITVPPKVTRMVVTVEPSAITR